MTTKEDEEWKPPPSQTIFPPIIAVPVQAAMFIWHLIRRK